MIQQPVLGKKITDLRKAKGLTQEELVDRCNLNVRTLQRIESGKVMPRTYTIRLIFEALEYSFDELQNDKGLIIKWLEQFYISFIDLFNLKTKTMRKITILSLIVITIVFGITSITNDLKAQDKGKKEKIEISGTFNGSNNQKEFNGQHVNCTINGVFFKSPLLIVDKKTHEFRSNSAKGVILKNKVEIKSMITKPENSSDNIVKNGDELVLKGNAKLIFSDSEIIEADEIIILKE